MTHLGLRVYRFTGHEIVDDPDGAVTQLASYISMGRY
jgi:very-short-patch-repair endonuclease